MRQAFAALLVLAAALPEAKADTVYIGSRASGDQQGIYAAKLDSGTGHLTGLGLVAPVGKANWLLRAPVAGTLYSVTDDSVVVLKADARGHLTETGRAGSGGGGATYLDYDPASRTLFVANYGTGQVAALPVAPDGGLSAAVSVVTDQGSGPSPRQKGPHAHQALLDPSRHFLLVSDLGADKVFLYRFDTKSRQLQPAGYEPLPPGSGPRHLVFHPNGKLAFLITELSAELKTYRWDAQKGGLTLTGTISTLAPDFQGKKSGAEIALSPDGRFLYLSNRGEDTIVVYAVDAKSGSVKETQRISSEGKDPWSFTLTHDARWMVVGNEASGDLTVLERDGKTGKLRSTGEKLASPNPVSVTISP